MRSPLGHISYVHQKAPVPTGALVGRSPNVALHVDRDPNPLGPTWPVTNDYVLKRSKRYGREMGHFLERSCLMVDQATSPDLHIVI